MKHLLLAAGLLLAGLSTGCKKGDSDPAPTPAPATATLLAKWQIDSAWVSGGTAATLYQKNKLQTYSAGKAAIEFAATQYTIYANGVVDKQYPYTRTGDVLQLVYTGTAADVYNAATIKVLTNRRLVLVSLYPQQNGQVNQYSTSTVTYSR